MAVSLSGAIAFLGARLEGDTFTGESSARQAQALRSAADAIDPYARGMSEQCLDAATYLQALWMLSPRAGLQAAGVASFSLTGLAETFNTKTRPAGIAPEAWQIIKYGIDGVGGSLSTSAGRSGPVWQR